MAQVLQRQATRGFDTGTRMVAKTDEQRVLWPQYVGNQDRPVVHRQYYDVIEDVAVILEETFRIRTWVLSASPLLYGWPKVRLRDGVKVLKGVREYYNAHPMTEVPMEGTVRTMSMQLIEYNLTMSQKGIGARMHGAVLERPEGAETLSKHMDAFAESAMMTMALQTAMKMVSTAWRQGVLSVGNEKGGMAYSRRVYNQLQMYAVLGKDTREVVRVVDELLSDNPEFNTIYLPDRTDVYFNTNIVPQVIAVPQFTYNGVGYEQIESTQTLQPISTLKGGAVTVLPMTKFSVYSANHEYQPLETTITIGEVYVDDQNMQLTPNQGVHYSGAMQDIYLWSHNVDFWRKVKFEDGLANSFVWNTSNNDSTGYSQQMLGFLETLIKNGSRPNDLLDAKLPLTYPVAETRANHPIKSKDKFFLPSLIGNLNEEHLTTDTLDDMINSYVNGLRNNANFVDIFGAQGSAMESLEAIRTEIEGLEYDAESLERMARLNISKRGNAFVNAQGRAAFSGTYTPRNRIPKNSRMQPIVEWAPNAYGSLDIDTQTHPIGMFNAAGIETIAKTQGHPLQQQAERAHRFLTRLAQHHFEIFTLTGNMTAKTHNISPHLHRDSRSQVVLDAIYGRRIPAFLAAPMSLVQPQQAANMPSSVSILDVSGESSVLLTTGNPDDGFITTGAADARVFWTPMGALFTISGEVNLNRYSPKETILGLDQLVANIHKAIDTDSVINDATKSLGQQTASTLLIELSRSFIQSALGAKKTADRELLTKLYLTLVQELKTGNVDKVNAGLSILNKSLNRSRRTDADAAIGDKVPDDAKQQAVQTIIQNAMQQQYATVLSAPESKLAEAYQVFQNTTDTAIREYMAQDGAVRPLNGFYYSADGNVTVENAVNLATAAGIDDATKDAIGTALNAIRTQLGVNANVADLVRIQKKGATDATFQDLQTARYYRAPLNFTMNLLKTVAQPNIVPWIVPADPTRHFDAPLDVNDEAAVAALMDHPYLVYSQGVVDPDHLMRPSSENYLVGLDATFHDLVVAYGVDDAKTMLANGPGLGQIHDLLWYVRREYFASPLKRLAGLSILMTPHDRIDAIRQIHRHNILVPFDILYWRLWSTHKMGDMLAMRAGVQAGINMFGHERMMVARDNTRDSVRIRATMDMESHPIDPSLHALAGPIQTRGYVGGHDAELVTSPSQLRTENRDIRDMPSVIATINVRGQGATREYPLSFVNLTPGRFDSSHEPRPTNPNRQYWSGAPFYAMVYQGYFNRKYLEKFDGNSRSVEPISYFRNAQRRNHLAFRGSHVRYQPKTGLFQREIPGNGHRADAQFNAPGAKDYFNGGAFIKNTSMLVSHTLA